MLRFALLIFPGLLLAGCPESPRTGDDDDDATATTDDDDATAADDDDSALDDDDDSTPPPVTAQSLECAPASPSLDYDWEAPTSVAFTATGTWSDGTVEDVTTTGSWSAAPLPGGEIDAAGLFTAPGTRAGPAVITVEWEALSASCSVDLHLSAVIDLTEDPVLAAAVANATTTYDDGCAPWVLYPLDGAKIPTDFFSPEIQWIPAGTHDTHVITFTSPWITLTAITQDASWRPDGDAWWAVASPASDEEVELRVVGGDYDEVAGLFPDGLCGSPWPRTFTTDWWGAEGTVFYWTPDTQGLWQIDIGSETATPWMDVSNTGQCVGCHSVNLANPTLLAVAQGNGGYGAAVVTDDVDPLNPLTSSARTVSFSALNPTGDRLVRVDHGVMYLDDLTLDVQLSTVPTTGWVTHPNWSPNGQWIVYAACAGANNGNDWEGQDCDLRLIEVLAGDTFGPEVSLAVAPPGQSYYYPTFSRDSQWVAFNRRSAGNENYDEPTAELMILPSTGGPPVLLAGANGLPNLTNSWPRWGPIIDDIGWLAFGSRRNYAQQTGGNAQVWVTGVDLALVAAGLDGSHAPVWLPGQSTTTGNHTPAFVQRPTTD